MPHENDTTSREHQAPASLAASGAPRHPREAERLDAVRQTGLLGGSPDTLQEAVVKLASEICGTPIAAVSLMDTDRQWFSAIHGLACRETPREVAFCAHTILVDAPMVVNDATKDPRFAGNPLVTGAPGIRFYAGVQLTLADRLPLGSLCVIDTVPRQLSTGQLESLRTLGALVASQLELYRRNTNLKAREEQQQEVLDRLNKISSRVPGVIYQFRQRADGSSCFPYASEGIREIYRVTPEQVREDASAVFAILHPDDLQAVAASIQESSRTLAPWKFEYRVRFSDGVERWLLGDALPEREADGGTLWHGFITDITKRKRSEEALAKLNTDLAASQAATEGALRENRALIATLNQHSIVSEADSQGRIVRINDSFCRISGYSRNELIGHDHRDFDSGEHPAAFRSEAWGTLSAGRAWRGEVCNKAKDGTLFWFDSIIAPFTGAEGQIEKYVSIHTDITARKRSEAELVLASRKAEAASRAKSAFLANMSHEIRTPLTAILGFADLLREDGNLASAPPQRLQAIDTIRNAGQHLLTVINDILDISKIEADRMSVEKVQTPLIGIVREVESLLRPPAASKGVKVNLSLATPVPERIMSDPTRLRQILMNLAGNAVKFTDAGAVTITVSAAESGGCSRLVIDVEDTGPGLTPEQAGRLFQAFGQADETVSRKHGGTGLGLTISRRLASMMGGDLKLHRTEPDKGSCFRLVLPLKPMPGTAVMTRLDAAEQAAASSPAEGSSKLRGRILLAEDGIDNQRLIGFHLKKAGATVEVAENGHVALRKLAAAVAEGRPFDLLLTDMQMPEMDGYTLARTLREQGSTIAIVALTAHAMAEDRARCERSGCDDYASKPIDKAALLATCAAWMGKKGGAKLVALTA